MTSVRHRSIVDLHIILRRGDCVLLGKRCNTGFCDGFYHLPAGHLEANESVLTGTVREISEELGIAVLVENLKFAFFLHQRSGDGRIALFFETSLWDGEPTNLEPDKCASLEWFPLAKLPQEMVSYARFTLERYNAGEFFALFGWE